MNIGYIGLGKMGLNMVTRLTSKGHEVLAYNRSEEPRLEVEKLGVKTFDSLANLAGSLESPRVVWIMVPHRVVDDILDELIPSLNVGDIVIDGGNSFYKDTLRRAELVSSKGVKYMDVGVSGGPRGALEGACLMVGGDREVFDKLEPVFKDLSVDGGYKYMGKNGAGHFTKMVHNGIEYGMMQSIAEGFEIMKKSEFDLNLTDVAELYNHGSVIESRLVGWLKAGYEKYDEELSEISGTVNHTGEGEWTVEAGKELGVPTPAISSAFKFRVDSENNPSYTGKVLSVLRNMFGGHDVK